MGWLERGQHGIENLVAVDEQSQPRPQRLELRQPRRDAVGNDPRTPRGDTMEIYERYASLFLHSNATFLCERAHAEVRTAASLEALASCYLRQGAAKRAYAVLCGCASSANRRYLLAVACYKLDKLAEAEAALLPDRGGGPQGEPSFDEENAMADAAAPPPPLTATTKPKALAFASRRPGSAYDDASSADKPRAKAGWVQHHVGKVHFEAADYEAAVRSLRTMRRVEPHRMAGLELLSTALWHLKDGVELCYFARHCVDFDARSPEAWCASGNCLSLQKEHDGAIRCFQRAIAVDPRFAYASTLCGHEYVANEDFEKAIGMYRHAMRIDERHYNAWYGLGAIYYRQEKYELAEYHFDRALCHNPTSSVLHCYLGMTLHANQKCHDALRHLRRAALMEPKNPQARFQCANVLISLDKYEDALAELRAVSDHAPREASVHFLMGKVCKLGRLDDAMMHFTFALDLEPKDNNAIKSAIDRLEARVRGRGARGVRSATPDLDSRRVFGRWGVVPRSDGHGFVAEYAHAFRPPGTIFCQECQILVEDYNHFCPWSGTAIGKGNERYFTAYLAAVVASLVFDLVVIALVLADEQ
ncbi:hypothetical protein JL720_5544 [Aureococcus anophagefferens]|nr:hypothetical protein JL720_5544 [Aureococcus anophagefferens]